MGVVIVNRKGKVSILTIVQDVLWDLAKVLTLKIGQDVKTGDSFLVEAELVN